MSVVDDSQRGGSGTLSWVGGAMGIAAAEIKSGMGWESGVVEVSGYRKVG